MQFVDFVVDVSHNVPSRDGVRDGQYALNRLAEEKPQLANFIAGSLTLDPFYDDKKLQKFFLFCHIVWDEPAEDYRAYYKIFMSNE